MRLVRIVARLTFYAMSLLLVLDVSLFTFRCVHYNQLSWEKGSTDWALEAHPGRLGFSNYYTLSHQHNLKPWEPFPGYVRKKFEHDGLPSDEPRLCELWLDFNSADHSLPNWLYDDYAVMSQLASVYDN